MRTIAPLLLLSFFLAACAGDSGGQAGSPDGATVSFLTTALPNAYVGQPYNATILSLGGTGPFVWRLSDGVLPPGIIMPTTNTSAQDFTGTPTQSGTWFFTVELRDVKNRVVSGTFHITVEGPSYFSFPASGTIVIVIDRSAGMAQATSTGPTRLELAQAAYTNVAANLDTNHDFDVLAVGASGEVTSLFGGAVAADSANLATAATNVQMLQPAGPCAMYSALQDALGNYGTPARVIVLGGARPGTDSGAPGGSTDPAEIEQAVQGWLASTPGTEIETRQFGDNSEVSLLYQNLALQGGGSFYYQP